MMAIGKGSNNHSTSSGKLNILLTKARKKDTAQNTPRHAITGSTVVLTCCKGDSSSQWETPIFGPPQTENPLTDLDKICQQ